MEPITIGIIGVLFILIGFILVEFKTPINTSSESYQIINIIGSGFLIYYAFLLQSLPFIILNIGWFGAAFYRLTRIVYRR